MFQPIEAHNLNDEHGMPSGGTVIATGLRIDWQNGPLGRGADRQEPNGAFVETVIEAARQRIAYYQDSKFACTENATALQHLQLALGALNERTAGREARDVEGTHEA